jgi:UDP-3-O-[3-hydroxymyristoyl] N-acetylglucosamine deacetylase
VAFEQTIEKPVSCSGIGLHSGAPVNLRIVPAPAGRGIIFRRTDLDNFEMDAVGRNVAKVSYATSLMRRGVLISTTEHLLSAFIGIGIDNAYVELDNLELPILDGSAKPFVDMVRSAGLKPQRRKRTYMRILKPVEVRDGDKFIGVYPVTEDDWGYSISYNIDFPAPIGKSSFSCELIGNGVSKPTIEDCHSEERSDEESALQFRSSAVRQFRNQVGLQADFYAREIAPARTFGYLHEADKLRGMGLIRGASEENAIVVTQTGVKNGPLRFADEFVRHKVLDLIGDLALLGNRILGKVVADRAGHAMHTALVSRLIRDRSLWEASMLDAAPAAKRSAQVNHHANV